MGSTKMCLGTTRQAKRPATEEEEEKTTKDGVITIWAHIMLGLKLVVPAISAPSHACVYINMELSFGQIGGSWCPDWSTLLDNLIE
jgi:hypothetical protein